MTKLSPTQQSVLTQAAKAPTSCVTTFMADIKNPMIHQRSLDSMLAKGLINERYTEPAMTLLVNLYWKRGC